MDSKNAMVTQQGLVMIILFAIGFAVVLIVGGDVYRASLGIGEGGTCSAEAVNKDFQDTLSDTGILTFFENTNIYLQNCKTDVKYVTKKKFPTKEDVDALFAEEAVQCYNQFKDLDIFPSSEKIPASQRAEEQSGWSKFANWAAHKATFGLVGGSTSVDGNGNVVANGYLAPPVYCVVCARIDFDEKYEAEFRGKDDLPMFTEYLKKHNTDIISSEESDYEFIDSGRYTGYTSVDTLERYSYDPTKTNVIVYYRRYAYDFSWKNWDDWLNQGTQLVTEFVNWVGGKVSGAVYGERNFNSLEVPVVKRSAKEQGIETVKEYYRNNLGAQLGVFSLMTIENKIGLYKWFSPFESNMEDEHGVASVPYEYVAHQCDFVANGYGKVTLT